QTLFNPNAYGHRLLDEAFIPALGIGAWWTLFVLAIHVVWSIAVPIALVESLVPADRAQKPWLGIFGLLVTTALFALGAIAIFVSGSRRQTWSPVHRFALAAGALLTYAWYGFVQHPTAGAAGKVALIGNGVFAAMAVGLLFIAGRRVTRAYRRGTATV